MAPAAALGPAILSSSMRTGVPRQTRWSAQRLISARAHPVVGRPAFCTACTDSPTPSEPWPAIRQHTSSSGSGRRHLGIQPGQRIDGEVLPGARLELHAEQATGTIASLRPRGRASAGLSLALKGRQHTVAAGECCAPNHHPHQIGWIQGTVQLSNPTRPELQGLEAGVLHGCPTWVSCCGPNIPVSLAWPIAPAGWG